MAEKKAKPYYIEPSDYFPKSIRKSAGLGEYADKGKAKDKPKTEKKSSTKRG